ncbi:MAG: NrsF family protein [Rickettsiales bacterium]|nr:NrsF family protein [Rickettsiales bacterium]
MKSNNLNNLINSLSEEAKFEVKYNASKSASIWLVFSVFYIIFISYIFGVREDINLIIKNPLYIIELVMLFLALILSSFSASFLASPDSKQKKYFLYSPFLAFLGVLISGILSQFFDGNYIANNAHNGIYCFSCVVILSLIPSTFLFLQIKKYAPTKLKFLGVLILLFSTAIGCLILRLTEPVDTLFHIIIWHYTPVFMLALIGIYLGKKFLSW